MSEFCIGVIYKQCSQYEKEKILEQMNQVTGYEQPHVTLCQYNFDFLKEAERQNFVIIDLCCSKWNNTCENLLMPDWCNVEEADERSPLIDRLYNIQNLLLFCVEYYGRMDLWIGGQWGDGDEEEYPILEITASCFVESILPLYEKCGCTPEVHFVILEK